MKLMLSELLVSINHAQLIGEAALTGISTDSRQIKAGDLFIALRGEHFDAHDFLAAVAQEGKAAAVVACQVPDGFPLPAILVPDTLIALGDIARMWRNKFSIPVIGVAGSNGKTTVKSMIASIFSSMVPENQFLATKGNLNNEIGVPLTVMQLEQGHRYAVIEMGMNHPGEMAYLNSIACPTVGLVNNAQREHQEFMQSVQAVAEENAEVLKHLPAQGTAVFPADDDYSLLWRRIVEETSRCKILSFGLHESADVFGSIKLDALGCDMTVFIGGQSCQLRLSVAGQHNALNALAAAACCYSVGIPLEVIKSGLEKFSPVAGRLQRKMAINGATIIDDTYNANPDSVRAAIGVLAQCQGKRLLVLGDMGEVGEQGVAYHQEVGAYARDCGVDQLMTLGELVQHACNAFGPAATHYDSVENLIAALTEQFSAGDAKNFTMLIKGSRFMKMERVVAFFTQQKITGTH